MSHRNCGPEPVPAAATGPADRRLYLGQVGRVLKISVPDGP